MTEQCIPVGFKLTVYDVDTDKKCYSALYDYQSQAIDYAKWLTLHAPHLRGVVSRTYPDHAYTDHDDIAAEAVASIGHFRAHYGEI